MVRQVSDDILHGLCSATPSSCLMLGRSQVSALPDGNLKMRKAVSEFAYSIINQLYFNKKKESEKEYIYN